MQIETLKIRPPGQLTLSRADLWLIIATLLVCLDGVANYFTQAPIFVIFSPFLILATLQHQSKSILIKNILIVLFIAIPFFIKGISGTLTKDDYSDFLLLTLSILSIRYFISNPVSERAINITFTLILAMFIPTFGGIDAAMKMAEQGNIFDASSSDIEFYRSYRSGLFRLAHVASYLLFLAAIWSFALRRNLKLPGLSLNWLIAGSLFSLFLIYTGSRTPIMAFALSIPTYYASRSIKGMLIAFFAILTLIVAILNIEAILDFTNGTILYQYFTFIKTAVDNPERLSRVMIWRSWYEAVSNFSPIDVLFGKSLSNAMIFNQAKLGISIWFHNDFLGIYYAYGIVGVSIYASTLYKLARKSFANNFSFYTFSVVFFIIFAAAANGLFKYYPFIFAAALNIKNTRLSIARSIITQRNFITQNPKT